MKICLVRLSALGDVVMMIPLVRTLRKNFSDASITWVIDQHFLPIVEHIEGVHFLPVKKIKNLFDYYKMRKIFRAYDFDLLLATQASFTAHLFYTLIQAKRKLGYDAIRGKDFHSFFVKETIDYAKEHTVEGFLRFATTIGAKERVLNGSIPLSETDRAWVKEKLPQNGYFVMNPLSTNPMKDWSIEKNVCVAREVISKYGLSLVLTGAKRDIAACDKICKQIRGKHYNLAGQTTLRQLAAVLEKGLFLITPDTGPAHIAGAMGIPVIGLFATSSSRATGPYFSNKYVIDKYEEALIRFDCVKHKEERWGRIYRNGVMDMITEHEVLETVSLILTKS